MHKVPLQLRFNDIDVMGHVNNAVIMEFFDLGKASFFKDAGLPPEKGDFTLMVVHYEVDFTSQIHASDSLSVTTEIVKFGTKSATLRQQVLKADGTVCATCNTVMAGYRRSTGSSDVVPEEVKQQIFQFQQGC